MRTFLVCGGGTGGHLYPALATLEGLHRAEPDARLVYVGSRYGLEMTVVPRYPWVEFYPICVRGIARPGQRPWWMLWALVAIAQLPVALAQALWVILKVRPRVIIGFGGYGAFAPLLWGVLFRIPIFLHEQNVVPGVVTRLFAPWAKRVFLTYPQTARWLRAHYVVVTGLPIRSEILYAHADHARFGLDPQKKTVLVFGGSRGSQLLTEVALQAHRLLREAQFLIITGSNSSTTAGEGVILVPYIHEMGTALATADLVICRAGAATLAELAALEKPAIVVPWAGAANDHQMSNAKSLAHLGVSIIPESELTPQRLVQEIQTRLRQTSSGQASLDVHLRRPMAGEGVQSRRSLALHSILCEVLHHATKEHDAASLPWDRRRRHEWVGQSLF
jgi:UDP-N-acetylglucosamine--N-acetylmuramyl-(pentapeptide) pyrophosphoryl-undecaprenol N-acetylglucosamine transferase